MRHRVSIPGLAVVLALLVSVAGFGVAAFGDDDQKAFSVFEKAFYLSAEDAAWIRPGLKLTLQDVSLPADRKLLVTFKVTDASNQPLDRTGIATPGTVSTSWILARIPQDSAQYVAYTTRNEGPSPISGKTAVQASSDSGGTYASLGNGVYTYKFGTALPADYDQAATHTLGVYSTRDLREWGLSRYVVNELKSWVPNGSAVTKIRDVVSTAACNNCHNPLGLHGGSRQKVELCILCHQPQTTDADSGNTQNMPVLIHRIHMGPNLASVQGGKPYIIYGHNMSLHDYSHTTYPQDIRNCTACHQNTKQVNQWMLNPTRATCGESCHDGINWETGAGHLAGPQPSDRFCANCHYPEGEREYDAGIKTAHVPPYRSSQLRRPKVEIVSITNTGPGQSPVVKFRITDKNGGRLLPSLFGGTTGRIALTIAGPTSDYRWYLQEAANTAPVDAGGVATYTFTGKIPADAKGTYAVEAEGRLVVTLNPNTAKATNYNDPIDTVVQYFAVTGTVAPRRTVADLAKCNKCHDKLLLHGNNRSTLEACVICHNPANTDAARRPASDNPPETIDMKILAHRIHTGEELENEYSVYGFGSRKIGFNEVLFPGDRRDCEQCHVAGAYVVPLPASVTPSVTPRGLWDPTRPTAAACLGCHDSIEAGAHAYLNTAPFGESCAVCHKESAEFAVTKAHAR